MTWPGEPDPYDRAVEIMRGGAPPTGSVFIASAILWLAERSEGQGVRLRHDTGGYFVDVYSRDDETANACVGSGHTAQIALARAIINTHEHLEEKAANGPS